MSLFIQEFQMGINTKIALRILVKVLCVNCQLSTKRYVHFHTYVFKLKENGNGTFPSKVVSKPSRGNFKVNLTVNVQSLVTLGIKNRLCRDNNRESDSKSIKDWYASDETNMVVKTKNDDQLNHMTDYDWLTASRIKGLTFIHMVFYVSIHFYSFKNSLDSTKSRENPIQKNCNEKLGESFACQLSTKRYLQFIHIQYALQKLLQSDHLGTFTKIWQFFTYVAKLNLNENGTFPSKVVSKPSRGKTKENLIVNVQSLVILGIKKRLCRDNNRESDSKSIKDWYASDKTNKAVNTKKDEHLNHMAEYDLLIDQGSNGLTFIYMICNVLIHPYASVFSRIF